MRRPYGLLSTLWFVDLAFDIAKPVLHETAGISNTLVVHRGTQLANHEVEKCLGAEIAQRLIEVFGEMVFEGAQDTSATVVGKADSHRRLTMCPSS
jgi:hypothetical protein